MAGSKRRKQKRAPSEKGKVSNVLVADAKDRTLDAAGKMSGKKTKNRKRRHFETDSTLTKKEDSTLSLSSRLKRLRGTADSTPMPPEWSQLSNHGACPFLSPDDGEAFVSCKNECYRGFYWEQPGELPDSLHSTFDQAFDALHDAGLFLYDSVQPGGKRLAKTFVTRTLVGKPGSTYRYLGLRLFSHPWTAVTKDGDAHEGDSVHFGMRSLVSLGYSRYCAKALLTMGTLNASLTERTKRVLSTEIAPDVPDGLVGSADYSLTLINRMEPTSVKKDLKQEKFYGMGKTSVSWHKDSGLTDFSSIAVYHSLRDEAGDDSNETLWRVALRVADRDVKTPALAVPLPGGSLYYLLDDFNHKHEHAVLTGSNQLRYSSTHRVAREGQGTWQYIRDKCRRVLNGTAQVEGTLSDRRKRLVNGTRAQQQLLDELEFEWLRQWYVQGRHHAGLHHFWDEPIKQLEEFFNELEQRSLQTIKRLQAPSRDKDKSGGQSAVVTEDVYDVLIEAFEARLSSRVAWHERVKDPIFESMPEEMRPFRSPVLDRTSGDDSLNLPEDLTKLVVELRKWRKLFVEQRKREADTTGNLTKNEKRKIASNWESMKVSFSKKAG